jgi:hypothetical protein
MHTSYVGDILHAHKNFRKLSSSHSSKIGSRDAEITGYQLVVHLHLCIFLCVKLCVQRELLAVCFPTLSHLISFSILSGQRIAGVTSTLQSRLERLFKEALDTRDRERLAHCLQAYASISRQEDAESMFQAAVVHPFLDKVVTTKALVSSSGLPGIYSQILTFFPKQCSLLLELTHPRPPAGAGGSAQPPRVPGFSFLVNAVWPELVAMLDQRIPAIFAPGNPDNFHKNYTATMEFVSSFESLCPTQASVRRLRAHSSFNLFLSKWSLPVYFQIRSSSTGYIYLQLRTSWDHENCRGVLYS